LTPGVGADPAVGFDKQWVGGLAGEIGFEEVLETPVVYHALCRVHEDNRTDGIVQLVNVVQAFGLRQGELDCGA